MGVSCAHGKFLKEILVSYFCTGFVFNGVVGGRMTTLLDVERALQYLSYLGYTYEHETALSAIQGRLFTLNCMFDLAFFETRMQKFCQCIALSCSDT